MRDTKPPVLLTVSGGVVLRGRGRKMAAMRLGRIQRPPFLSQLRTVVAAAAAGSALGVEGSGGLQHLSLVMSERSDSWKRVLLLLGFGRLFAWTAHIMLWLLLLLLVSHVSASHERKVVSEVLVKVCSPRQ